MSEERASVLRAAEIARLVGGRLEGDPELAIRGVQDLAAAGPDQAAFFVAGRRAPALPPTQAGLLLLRPGVEAGGRACVRVANPALAAALVARRFHSGPRRYPAGVHPSAVVEAGARVDARASVGPLCVVRDGARVEGEVVLCARVYVGEGARIGAGSYLHPGVVVEHGVTIGKGCEIQANTVIGSEGFGYVWDGQRHLKVPQQGTVEIGDGVEIGANCAIDRATFTATRIGAGCVIDNLVQIGHNCTLEEFVVLCGQVGLSGGTRVGRGAMLGGQVGSPGHLTIGAGAQLAARAAPLSDVPPGARYAGAPAWDLKLERRAWAALRKLALEGRAGEPEGS